MKALIYSAVTLVVLVTGMNIASSLANKASESINENTSNKYEVLEQQLQGK